MQSATRDAKKKLIVVFTACVSQIHLKRIMSYRNPGIRIQHLQGSSAGQFRVVGNATGRFGQLEKDLLLRIIPCIDPNSHAIAGLKAKVLHTLGLDTGELEDKEKQYRETLLKRFRSELIPTERLIGQPGKIPGLGPSEVESAWSIPIRLDGISIIAEKLARGCEFKLKGRYVEDPYGVVTFIREGDLAEVPDQFKHIVEAFDFGPGCRIQRISVPADTNVVRYCIAILGRIVLGCDC
jgi:hypothetical protein